MKISEQELVNHLKEFIDNCDVDELARIAGEVFGGKCYWVETVDEIENLSFEDIYDFEPDEYYGGEFGDIE